MSEVRVTVCWGPDRARPFCMEEGSLLQEFIEEIQTVVASQLPEQEHSERIVYALFRKDAEGGYEQLRNRHQTLKAARIVGGKELYFANPKQPWWEVQSIQPLPLSGNGEAVLASSAGTTCDLLVGDGRVVQVAVTGVVINRAYLLQHLPRPMRLKEEARLFMGLPSRLMQVGREHHAEVWREDGRWFVRATRPMYVNGRFIDRGVTLPVNVSVKIVLGRDGWPIELRLSSSA